MRPGGISGRVGRGWRVGGGGTGRHAWTNEDRCWGWQWEPGAVGGRGLVEGLRHPGRWGINRDTGLLSVRTSLALCSYKEWDLAQFKMLGVCQWQENCWQNPNSHWLNIFSQKTRRSPSSQLSSLFVTHSNEWVYLSIRHEGFFVHYDTLFYSLLVCFYAMFICVWWPEDTFQPSWAIHMCCITVL